LGGRGQRRRAGGRKMYIYIYIHIHVLTCMHARTIVLLHKVEFLKK